MTKYILLLLLAGNAQAHEYQYRALITKVYDGDTVTATIDAGFNIELKNEKIRLYGIDAPEMRGEQRPEGLVSRDWLRSRVLNKKVILHTIKDKKGKYGRYLAVIYLNGVNINDELVTSGMAVYKDY